jgi:SAM-dependent methyltransferase
MDYNNFISPNHLPLMRKKEVDELTDGVISYVIQNDIPRFVKSENYTEAFGLQWNTFRRTQFDSYTKVNITEKRLENSLGFPLGKLKGKKVLEAGSGAGRFTEILLKHGAIVYSFDYSSAVDANFLNNMPNENLTLFQADILEIPFVDLFFDTVVCLGVLQHTPSSERSIRELNRVLKKGGSFVFDHYKWHLGNFTTLYMVYWFIIKKFNPSTQLKITSCLVRIFHPIHWCFRDSGFIQLLLRRISPINFYYGRYELPKEILYEWSMLDTHDRNTDYYKRHYTMRGFKKLISKFPFENLKIHYGGTGIVCSGIKSEL